MDVIEWPKDYDQRILCSTFYEICWQCQYIELGTRTCSWVYHKYKDDDNKRLQGKKKKKISPRGLKGNVKNGNKSEIVTSWLEGPKA